MSCDQLFIHSEAASLASIFWTGAFRMKMFVALEASMPASASVVRPFMCRFRCQLIAASTAWSAASFPLMFW